MTACHPQDHTWAVVCVRAHRRVYVCVDMCVHEGVYTGGDDVGPRERRKAGESAHLF